MLQGYVVQVTVCFLIVGHTHNDVDQKISVFSWALRRGVRAALSFFSYVSIFMHDAFKLESNRPTDVQWLESVHDWAAWLEPTVSSGLSRYGCSNETSDAIRCFKFKRGPSYDDPNASPADRVRLFYKKYMSDRETLPRPLQKGQIHEGGEVQDQGVYDRATRTWTCQVKKAGVTRAVQLKSHGIPILGSLPATSAPRVGATPAAWPEQLRHLTANIAEHDTSWFADGQHAADRAWWKEFIAGITARTEPPDAPDATLRWPLKCADAPEPVDMEHDGADERAPEADPLQHGAARGVHAYGRVDRLGVADALAEDSSRLVDAHEKQFVLYMYKVDAPGPADAPAVLYGCALGVVQSKDDAGFKVHWWCRTGREVRSYAPFIPTGQFRKSTARDAGQDDNGNQIPHVIEIDRSHLIYALSYFSGGESLPLLTLNADGSIPKGKKVAGGRKLVDDLGDHFAEWQGVHAGELLTDKENTDPFSE